MSCSSLTNQIVWRITKPMTEPSVGKLTQQVTRLLSTIENPHENALVLLAHVLGKPKTWLIAHPETYLTPDQSKQLQGLVDRLCKGEPLPYLTGHQEFFGLDFKVTPNVLIPRPETELLVELALEWLHAHPDAKHGLDVGTGSGCIPVSILKHYFHVNFTAVDVSESALAIAAQNATTHSVTDRVQFLQSNLLENVTGSFNLITANLPYIPTAKLADLKNLDYEPKLALDGGLDGLVFISRLLWQAQDHLTQPGLILLEIESSTGEEAMQLARSAYLSAHISIHQDLAGHDRVVAIEMD